jgi:hypothetical protein
MNMQRETRPLTTSRRRDVLRENLQVFQPCEMKSAAWPWAVHGGTNSIFWRSTPVLGSRYLLSPHPHRLASKESCNAITWLLDCRRLY